MTAFAPGQTWEAHFRAAVTGLRYRVMWDRANRLWDLREMVEPVRVPRGDADQ